MVDNGFKGSDGLMRHPADGKTIVFAVTKRPNAVRFVGIESEADGAAVLPRFAAMTILALGGGFWRGLIHISARFLRSD